jgi:hypothetical protein
LAGAVFAVRFGVALRAVVLGLLFLVRDGLRPEVLRADVLRLDPERPPAADFLAALLLRPLVPALFFEAAALRPPCFFAVVFPLRFEDAAALRL